MTIYSFQNSSLHNSESATSLFSLSALSNNLSNTETSASEMSLTQLFPALPSQDEDWKRFGYLLDSSNNNLALNDDYMVSSSSSYDKICRSNSMFTSPNVSDSGYTSSGSSMDVENGSIAVSKPCPTCEFLKAYEDDFIEKNQAKQDLLLKFLLDNNNTQKKPIANTCLNTACRPRWHTKLLKLPSTSVRNKRRNKSRKVQNRYSGKKLKGLQFCRFFLTFLF